MGDVLPSAPSTSAPRTAGALSALQHPLWILDRLVPGVAAQLCVVANRLVGPLDVAALWAALDDVVARHEALRLTFADGGAGPSWQVADAGPVGLTVAVMDGDDLGERRAAALSRARELVAAPFRLDRGPLWRAAVYVCDPGEHLFVWVGHGLVADEASAAILAEDLSRCYTARRASAPPPPPDAGYAAFAARQAALLEDSGPARLIDNARDRLSDLRPVPLQTDRPRSAQPVLRAGSSTRQLGSGVVAAAAGCAAQAGALSTFPVYLAALAVLLRRYSGQDDIVVGYPVDRRAGAEIGRLVGQCTDLRPIRVEIDPDESFLDLVRRVDADLAAASTAVDLPFSRLVEALSPARDPARMALAPLALRPGAAPALLALPDVTARVERFPAAAAPHDLAWRITEDGERSAIEAEYRDELFDVATVDSLLAHLRSVLADGLADPHRRVRELQLLSDDERDELLRRWDGPRLAVPHTTIDLWFAEVVARSPDAVAVVAGAEHLTYARLDDRSDRLAVLLTERGVGPGDRVGLCLPRGIEHVVAVLAVLKVGAVFVPIDPANPAERTARLLAECSPRLVLVTSAVDRTGWGATIATVEVDAVAVRLADGPAHHPPALPADDRLAYVIYTSGSTGTPKGVMIGHHNVVNFINSVRELFHLTADDRVLGYASYSFDVSVFEMFAALLSGASLHVAMDADRLDPDRLQRLLADAAITVIDLPPTVMALLDPSALRELRVSFVGGEAFSGDLVNRWNRVSRFFNGYGPTECTVTMIVHECPGRWHGSPPIGLPMANHVAHVLDADLDLVPYGVAGELVIGGAGLAAGYLDDPELTRTKFVVDPFGTTADGRLYRTGDLVKRRRDGALVFLGRVDRQVKVRGIRIEPGEIEAALVAVPGVRQAHVEAGSGRKGQPHLVAYVGVPDEPRPTAAELRAAIAATLPAALVPQHVFVLPELPLTTSGKIDRRALPVADVAGGSSAAHTSTEKTIVEELVDPRLRVRPPDVNADFFDLGGTSMQAATLVVAASRRFEVDLALADFLHDPTIAGLARLVDQEQAATWM